MPYRLRCSQANWEAIRRHCRTSFRPGRPPETAIIGLLGANPTSGEYLLAELLFPSDGDLKVAQHGHVVLSAQYLRRAHLQMRERGLAGLLTVHTHPNAHAQVSFSPYDESEDPQLIANLQEIEPRTILLSVVLGKMSQSARIWTAPDHFENVDPIIAIGERILSFCGLGVPPSAPPPTEGLFDSALAVTGVGALAQLGRMTAAVIGASGTGSLVSELLLRAGCKKVLIVDDDVAEDRNGNRILYLTAEDISKGTRKVDLLAAGLRNLGFGTVVEPVFGNVLDRNILARLKKADVIFGCVDKAMPRKLLSEFAFQYLKPYIDVGTEIGGDDQGIVSLDARVSYVAPGRPCLSCTGIVTARQLRFESLTFEERQREIALGYSDDLAIKQPAVMDLNMRAASLGTLVLRHLLQAFLLTPLPLAVHENIVTYTTRPSNTPRNLEHACSRCQKNSYFGAGDCGPELGYPSEIVERLRRPSA
jgi:hypothetical protein